MSVRMMMQGRKPAGGGGSSPPPVAGYSLWLDASDAATITASGGAVSQWNDKSGNDLHVTQATGANQPTTGATTQNGLNVLSFDSTDTLQRASTSLGASALTIFKVFRKTGSANTYECLPLTLTSSNNGRPLDGWDTNRFVGGNAYSGTYTNIKTQTSWCQLTITAASASPNTYSERKDGVAVASGTQGDTWSTSGQALILASRGDGVTKFTGDIAEIIVYESALGSTDRDSIEDYLATKWGTP